MEIIDSKESKYKQFIDKNTLKYGYCSYFSLVILNEFPEHKAIKIVDYDSEIQVNYLVHIVLQKDNKYIDALGKYQYLTHSIMDISDIEFMNLQTKYVTKDDIKQQIINDIGHYDHDLYRYIRTYVRKHYRIYA